MVNADLIGSLGVVAAALIVRSTGYDYADPIIAAGIGLHPPPRLTGWDEKPSGSCTSPPRGSRPR